MTIDSNVIAKRPSLLGDYITVEEFAAEFGIHKRTVLNYRKEVNGLPWMQVGHTVYIPLAAAREWIERRIQQPNPVRRAAVPYTGKPRGRPRKHPVAAERAEAS